MASRGAGNERPDDLDDAEYEVTVTEPEMTVEEGHQRREEKGRPMTRAEQERRSEALDEGAFREEAIEQATPDDYEIPEATRQRLEDRSDGG